jgi:hypothetical protein
MGEKKHPEFPAFGVEPIICERRLTGSRGGVGGGSICSLASVAIFEETPENITRSLLTMKWDLSFLSRHWLGAVGHPSRQAGRGKPRLQSGEGVRYSLSYRAR